MSVVVVGSVAFDSIQTPFDCAERVLGGSAVHAALAAAFFTDVRVVAAVGEDFDDYHFTSLEASGVTTEEIARVPGARTFTWSGRYDLDLGVPHTEQIALNVFDGWRPELGRAAREGDILFLGAMDPEIQQAVRAQWEGSKWAMLDSLGYWIETKRDALVEAIRAVDIVLLKDHEARRLTGERTILEAAQEIRSWGPKAVILKLGEYGCALLHEDGFFSMPGYPLEETFDPTGTRDALAGGFIGYLDRLPPGRLSPEVLRQALTYGSAMASYCAEDFGARRLAHITEYEVSHRVRDFRQMTHFEHVPTRPRPLDGPDERPEALERPHSTPTTDRHEPPPATSGNRQHRSSPRTPSTEPLQPFLKPVPPERSA